MGMAQGGPIFFGHGEKDPLIPMKLGEDTRDFCKTLDLEVSWKQYASLGHWYSDEMLEDLVEFIAAKMLPA